MLQSLPRSAFAAALSIAACTAATPVQAEDADVALEERADDTHEKDKRTARSSTPWLGDTVQVTAKGTAADVPDALATETVRWDEAIAAPLDFQDFITRVPGVGATGQNGLFETFSIRGSGANGILVLVGGMPITAQRRAGVPVSFVEPSLLGDIGVTLRNPEEIGREAAIDPSAGGNPIPVDAATLERIFRSAVKGDLSLKS